MPFELELIGDLCTGLCVSFWRIKSWEFCDFDCVAEWDNWGGEEDCYHIEWSWSSFWRCSGYVLFELLWCPSYSCFQYGSDVLFLAEVVVSPPFVFLPFVKSLLRSDFQVAAQNCWVRKGGAFTGEIRYVQISFITVVLGIQFLDRMICQMISHGLLVTITFAV